MSDVKLSDQLGAMAIIDDLYHQQLLVDEHLDQVALRQTIATKIKAFYAAKGLAIDDQMVEEGVHRWYDQRLRFTAPKTSWLQQKIARLYINRGRWFRRLGLLGLVLLICFAGLAYWDYHNQQEIRVADKIVLNASDIVHKIEALHVPTNEMQQVLALQQSVAHNAKTQALQKAKNQTDTLNDYLNLAQTSLTLSIVDRDGMDSGIERTFEKSGGKAWYLVVEARNAAGEIYPLWVTNSETGIVSKVNHHALRVSQQLFNDVRQDKNDDGHIDHHIMGQKPIGRLLFDYSRPVMSGVITEW